MTRSEAFSEGCWVAHACVWLHRFLCLFDHLGSGKQRHSLPVCILRVWGCWRAAARGQAAAFLPGRQGKMRRQRLHRSKRSSWTGDSTMEMSHGEGDGGRCVS